SELDGKRSLLASASRQIELARKLLQSSSHLWLDAWSQINAVAISILQGDFDEALARGAEALSSNFDCGVRRGVRSSVGKLGHIHLMRGDFARALEYFNRVVQQGPYGNEQVLSATENIAQVHLALGAFDECLKFLDKPEWNPSGAGRYAHRYGLLTRAQVLFRLGRWNEGLSCAEHIQSLAQHVEHESLLAAAHLLRSESLVHLGRVEASWAAIAMVAPSLSRNLPNTSAQYERATACVLAASGRIESGRRHRERAERIFRGLGNA